MHTVFFSSPILIFKHDEPNFMPTDLHPIVRNVGQALTQLHLPLFFNEVAAAVRAYVERETYWTESCEFI